MTGKERRIAGDAGRAAGVVLALHAGPYAVDLHACGVGVNAVGALWGSSAVLADVALAGEAALAVAIFETLDTDAVLVVGLLRRARRAARADALAVAGAGGAVGVVEALDADALAVGVGLVGGALGALAGLAVAALGAGRDANAHLNGVDLLAGGASRADAACATNRGAILAYLVAAIAIGTLPILLAGAALGLGLDALAGVLVAGLALSARGVKAGGLAVELGGDALLARGGECIAHPARGAVIVRRALFEAEGAAAKRLAAAVGAVRILRAGNAAGDLVARIYRSVILYDIPRVRGDVRVHGSARFTLLELVADLTSFRVAVCVFLAEDRGAVLLIWFRWIDARRSAELCGTLRMLRTLDLGARAVNTDVAQLAFRVVTTFRSARSFRVAAPINQTDRQNEHKPSKSHVNLPERITPLIAKAFEIVPSVRRNSSAFLA